jgi:hypothetical protein
MPECLNDFTPSSLHASIRSQICGRPINQTLNLKSSLITLQIRSVSKSDKIKTMRVVSVLVPVLVPVPT